MKLAYLAPAMHHSGGTVCEPVDIPVNKRHLDMVYSHIRYSDKPFMGSVTAPERAEDTVAMAKIVFGDDFVEQNCVMINLINANSPMVFDETMLGALKVYARHNQATVVSPFILAGAMSPVTVTGTLTQILAEAMAGMCVLADSAAGRAGGVRHLRQLDLHAVRGADIRDAGTRARALWRGPAGAAARRAVPLRRLALRLQARRTRRPRLRAPTPWCRPCWRGQLRAPLRRLARGRAGLRATRSSSSTPISCAMMQKFAAGH